MSLFHFNIPISTNGLFHNPISTNPPITNPDITPSINTNITSTSTTIPITPTISEIRHQRSKYAFERTFQVWGKSKLACSYVQASHASSAKFLRSPALSTGQAIGASILSLARCGGLWDYPRALKAGLLNPTATDPDQLGSPSRCILCHAHLDCKSMANLVVDCTHPTVFFARVDTQLLQSINDTRLQIFDCTLHTTTTTTTTTTTPASPSLSTTSINGSPDSTGTSAIWDSMDIHTPIDNYQHSSRPTSQSAPSSPSSPSGFPFFSFFSLFTTHAFRAANQRCSLGNSPTVLLGGSLPGTNTAGNTEACPGQQWLTGTVEEGNLLGSNQPTAVADHFVIRTSIRAEAQGQPPVPRAPTISRHHCLKATDRIATSNYWDVLADGAADSTNTDTDIHQLISQFLESANAVADNLSLRLSPPATRSNRRLLSGTTKRAILASNTARQAFISAATNRNPDPVQCNTLRDEWSRLKATATQTRESGWS
ncbi:hypothetical protein BASA60_005329 [Batrachochytrium salamandrivorans]|nr:hypothetical protein BASA60_005329 [Batrachochytrium salamandrivorans]